MDPQTIKIVKRIGIVVVSIGVIGYIICCLRGGCGCGAGGLPDYRVSFVSAPGSASRGQQITVTICTTNSSNFDKATSSSKTHWFINTSATISGATALGTGTVAALAAKGYTNWTTSATIPQNQPTGQNYLIAVCDFLNQVAESNENNNTNTPSQSITIN